MDSIHRWPGSGQEHRTHAEQSGQRRLPGEVAFPTSKTASVQSSVPGWDPRMLPAWGHLETGPWEFLGLCFAPRPLVPANPLEHSSFRMAFNWVRVHLPTDSELLEGRTRLGPSESRAHPGCPEPEAGGVIVSSTPTQVTVYDAGAGTSRQHYHCCRDSIRCGAGRGTRPQLCHRAGTQSKTVHANPVMGLRPPPKAVCRLSRGCPRALDAGNPPLRPPTGTGGHPLSLPGLGAPPPGPRTGPSLS